MGIYLVILLLALIDLPLELSAKQYVLEGRVFQLGDSGMSKPVPGVEVRLVHVKNPYTTKNDADKVLVPSAYVFGQSIELQVDMRGWSIAKPETGKFELPLDLTKDLLLK
ncbi:MAG: hypothetical protein NW703_05155 [Nitrospiraceae bacterium]